MRRYRELMQLKSDKLEMLQYKDAWVIVNRNGEYKHHTHIKYKSTCELLVKLVMRKQVLRSPYLRSSAKRLTLDMNYITDINNKIKKDRNKQRYYNKGERYE